MTTLRNGICVGAVVVSVLLAALTGWCVARRPAGSTQSRMGSDGSGPGVLLTILDETEVLDVTEQGGQRWVLTADGLYSWDIGEGLTAQCEELVPAKVSSFVSFTGELHFVASTKRAPSRGTRLWKVLPGSGAGTNCEEVSNSVGQVKFAWARGERLWVVGDTKIIFIEHLSGVEHNLPLELPQGSVITHFAPGSRSHLVAISGGAAKTGKFVWVTDHEMADCSSDDLDLQKPLYQLEAGWDQKTFWFSVRSGASHHSPLFRITCEDGIGPSYDLHRQFEYLGASPVGLLFGTERGLFLLRDDHDTPLKLAQYPSEIFTNASFAQGRLWIQSSHKIYRSLEHRETVLEQESQRSFYEEIPVQALRKENTPEESQNRSLKSIYTEGAYPVAPGKMTFFGKSGLYLYCIDCQLRVEPLGLLAFSNEVTLKGVVTSAGGQELPWSKPSEYFSLVERDLQVFQDKLRDGDFERQAMLEPGWGAVHVAVRDVEGNLVAHQDFQRVVFKPAWQYTLSAVFLLLTAVGAIEAITYLRKLIFGKKRGDETGDSS